MSSFLGSQESSTNTTAPEKNPPWFQNPAKRVIPNHLVPKKRLAFQLSGSSTNKKESKSAKSNQAGANSNTFNSTDFNLISFGNTAHRNSSASYADASSLLLTGDVNDTTQNFDNDDLPLYNDNEDLPPARSLYDLNDEVIISLNKPSQHTQSFINKDPKTFVNAFHQKSEGANLSEDEKTKSASPLSHNESAILVFGYPEAMSSQVIAYFSDFGTILEHFEASKPSKGTQANALSSIVPAGAFESVNQSVVSATSLPIFSGNSWVKLTYNNPASALDALQESGNVFNGVLIGVVPYTKDAIEKLQKRKLSTSEDIGGGFQLFSKKESSQADKVSETNDIQNSYVKRLDIKDGSGLFLNAKAKDQAQGEKKNEEKLGVLASLSRYFFGFHDL